MLLAARHDITLYWQPGMRIPTDADVCLRMLTSADVCCWQPGMRSEQLALTWTRKGRERCSVYLLYWYKSTITGTKVLMEGRGAQLACFTGKKVLLLVQKYSYWYKSTNGRARSSAYLLYWYKSTNTDAEGAALLVQKYKY